MECAVGLGQLKKAVKLRVVQQTAGLKLNEADTMESDH
jgi:hypothetical protein